MLASENVQRIFADCLLRPHMGEEKHARIAARGITMTKAFHFNRLAAHHAEICAMLDELPQDFNTETGMVFSEAHWSANGCLWTNMDDLVLEKLVMLGAAIDKAAWCHQHGEKPTKSSRFRLK